MSIQIINKITIPATEMKGGEISAFRGCECNGVTEQKNLSTTKTCIRLNSGRSITGHFNWNLSDEASDRTIFRFRGMWDMYKDFPIIPQCFFKLADPRGWFVIKINGEILFDSWIHFLNYRKWRFWPAVEIILPETLLSKGRNTFEIHNKTLEFTPVGKPEPVIEKLSKETDYQVSEVEILPLCYNTREDACTLPDNIYIGHIFCGHDVYYYPNCQNWFLEKFIHLEQGNLAVFLASDRMGGSAIDWSDIDPAVFNEYNLYCAMRYYGYLDYFDIDNDEYKAKLKAFVDKMGKRFIGFAPHEQHGQMHILARNNPDKPVSWYSEQYINSFKNRLKDIHETATCPVWDTDPSFYSRWHLTAGADLAAIELCVYNVSMDIASARGTAKGFGHKEWACINSFECQAWGGLSVDWQFIKHQKDFELKRSNLWRISQFIAYLGGARVLYSESGILDHKVTIQAEFDHPYLQSLQQSQTKLVEFACKYPLTSQPECHFGFIQGRNDISKSAGHREFKNIIKDAGESWSIAQSIFVNARPTLDVSSCNYSRDLIGENYASRDMISDTPFGDADIIPIESPEGFNSYKLLAVCGWNQLLDDDYNRLYDYVNNGGTLFIMLPQLSSADTPGNILSHINMKALQELGGMSAESLQANADINILSFSEPGLAEQYPGTSTFISNLPNSIHTKTSIFSCKSVQLCAEKQTQIILQDIYSGHPIITSHQLGKGKCFLINTSAYPASELLYQLTSELIRDVIRQIPIDISMITGNNINWFVYDSPAPGINKRIFIVRNDWFNTSNTSTKTEFLINGKTVALSITQGQVGIIDYRNDSTFQTSLFE